MVRESDLVWGVNKGESIEKPDWKKVFLYLGKERVIKQHDCLFEGIDGYEKLQHHVIVCQILIKGDKRQGIEHTPIFNEPSKFQPRIKLSSEQKIWRHMELWKFKDLLDTKTLYFARLDQFKDRKEGISSKTCQVALELDERNTEQQKNESLRLFKARLNSNRKNGFACCWHIHKKLNNAMWNEYGSNKVESIAIQTNFNKLNKVTLRAEIPIINEPIRYFDEPFFNQEVYWFPQFFKRTKFSCDKELSRIFFLPGQITNYGLRIKIDVENPISKVYVHPDATKEHFKNIKELMRDNGVKIPVWKG